MYRAPSNNGFQMKPRNFPLIFVAACREGDVEEARFVIIKFIYSENEIFREIDAFFGKSDENLVALVWSFLDVQGMTLQGIHDVFLQACGNKVPGIVKLLLQVRKVFVLLLLLWMKNFFLENSGASLKSMKQFTFFLHFFHKFSLRQAEI